jgi:ATP phosphoribosyltransferase regulatory subunit
VSRTPSAAVLGGNETRAAGALERDHDPFLFPRAPLRTPKGMGDLLPPEATARRALTRLVLHSFELRGYDLLLTPLFEHAEVVERGTDALDPRDLLRFVEPESGEVAVLRPDITPQVARVIATRMADHPPPWRLCYEGRVIRRRRGRARSHQQLTQAGVECVGLAGPQSDAEILRLAYEACRTAGLPNVRIELSQVTIAQSILDELTPALRNPVSEMLARKDAAALLRLVHDAHLPQRLGERLCALVEHYGELDVLRSAARSLRWPAATAALKNLGEIVELATADGLRDRLGVDLSDARGSSYYTGMSFSLLAEGPGEPVGTGGRYDRLLARYGMDQPATGFAFDLENLQWALREAGHVYDLEQALLRVVLFAREPQAHAETLDGLRARDVVVATAPNCPDLDSCLAFARAWRYDAVFVPGRARGTDAGSRARLIRVRDRSETVLERGAAEAGRARATRATKAAAPAVAQIVALKAWAQTAKD